MYREAASGLHLFPAGVAWEAAYRGAVDFLRENEAGTVLLGPGIGDCGRHWLEEARLRQETLGVGARVQDWDEWVTARARGFALGAGEGFRVLEEPARRELFRVLLAKLEEQGALGHLAELRKEERFFDSLLACVEEARLAGLQDEAAVMRARELLAAGNDPVTRDSYDDFWKLLLLFEKALEGDPGLHDRPALFRRAAAERGDEVDLYLLGLDQLSLLETDLVQLVARRRGVFLPLALGKEELESLRRGREAGEGSLAAALARGLLTNFPGAVAVHDPGAGEEPEPRQARLLSGHAPSEEARSAAALARFALEGDFREARFVLDPARLEDETVAAAFREELGLPRRFHDLCILSQPVARLFLHALELKERGFPLSHGLELARLLQFTLGRFAAVPALAQAAGITKGLLRWQEAAAELRSPELGDFVEVLAEIDRILPEHGPGARFAEAVERLAELCGIGELARRAPAGEIEREAHASLGALVRNAQRLAVAVKEELAFTEWLREWKATLRRAKAPLSRSFYPRVQFHRLGDWLPPAEEGTLTLVLGFEKGVEPRRGFHFYLEEAARRKLSDLQLPSQGQEDLSFLDKMTRVVRGGGITLLSWSQLDGSGREQQPSWIASALPLARGAWPEIARASGAAPFRAREDVRVPSPSLSGYSASLLETYKECPFKAFVLKVLRLEDKMQAASLDLGALELGSIVHRTLELYYGERKGKEIRDTAARGEALRECLARAVAEQQVEYFKGGASLLAFQVRRLERMLLSFLEGDAAHYAEFPCFGQPLVEHKVSGELAGKLRWTGKIDRVDLDEANRRFLVVDYKTGASTPKSGEIRAGDPGDIRRFQLQMYMDAVEAERPGWSAIGGLYVSLRTGERKQGLVRKRFNRTEKSAPGEIAYFRLHPRCGALAGDEDFESAREQARAEAARVAGLAGEGAFPVAPLEEDACRRCEARPACRIRELRAPPRRPWPRRLPREAFAELLHGAGEAAGDNKARAAKGFNREQADALERRGSLVFVEASAGTGKTTVIVERIRRFLLERLAEGEPAFRAVEGFAAISFTEKSAQELGARVSAALVQEPGLGARAAAQAVRQITTVHGFCRRILSDFPLEAGVSPLAELLDERRAEALLESAFEDFFLGAAGEARESLEALLEGFPRAKVESFLRALLERRLLLRTDADLYSAWLSGATEAPGALAQPGREKEQLRHLLRASEAFFAAFDGAKRERDALDFNDLEAFALRALGHEHVRDSYRRRFGLVLVDEFQDTNPVQREILERLAIPGWKNLFVVGDAKQSIYRFRAADVSVFQALRREASSRGELVTLSRNYRSRRELVEAANAVTRSVFPAPGADAPDFEAVAAESVPEREGGGRVALVEYGDPSRKGSAAERRAEEAALVADLIRGQLARGRRAGEIAVLLRRLSGNDAYLQALTAAGIPFRVGSSRGFYSQQVVLDALALLRALGGGRNDMALLALLRSPWARLSDARILALQGRGAASAALWDLLDEGDAPLLFEWRRLASFLPPSELLSAAFRHYPLDRREHLQAMKLVSTLSALERDGLSFTEIVERLSAWAGWEREEDSLDDSTMPEPGDGGAVQVMTVHASKGLEFDAVILPDLVSGLAGGRSSLRLVPGVGMALKLEDEESPVAYEEVGERDRERDLAESKRLLYVAFTRAREECVLLLPKEAEDPKKRAKADTWAGMLRASGLAFATASPAPAPAEAIPRAAGPAREGPAADERAETPPRRSAPRIETSITEIAAYQFCPEFHRRKYVQLWDDRVVGLWPNPKGSFRKSTGGTKGKDQGRDYAGRLLRALQLENKERGIALHRVLERVKGPAFDEATARLWLSEAYAAQGADVESPHFHELAELDLALLVRFLASPLGRELFAEGAEAFTELPFQWKIAGSYLQGAIDRVIRRADGSWLVVDYKSSLLEESRERYRFQVASYMAAVAAYARGRFGGEPRVEGYLVDLYEASSHPVEADTAQATRALETEIGKVARARVQAGLYLEEGPALAGGEHCFSCPYSLHCEIGKEIMLGSP